MTSPSPATATPWWDAQTRHPEFQRDTAPSSDVDRGLWAILESQVQTGLVGSTRLPEPALMCLTALRQPEARAAVDVSAVLARYPAFGDCFLALAQVAGWWPSDANGPQALERMGVRRLRLLTWAAALAARFREQLGSAATAHLQMAAATATACRHVALRLGFDADQAWIAGWFHDAGAACVDGAAAELEARGWPVAKRPHFRAWKARLHAIAGAELTLAWDLPDDVVDGASHHFDHGGPMTVDMALVALANRIAVRLRHRDDDDGGMVVTNAITKALQKDRLTILSTLHGVESAVESAADYIRESCASR